MRHYIIQPVRHSTPEQIKEIQEYVSILETQGEKVHFPPRDADQNDPTGGINICKTHLKAMVDCDVVDIFWDCNSTGSHFDLGMAWALKKKIKLVKTYNADHTGKSYLKIIQGWSFNE
jgi:nucleoside 2-deoxyribosyltransferase